MRAVGEVLGRLWPAAAVTLALLLPIGEALTFAPRADAEQDVTRCQAGGRRAAKARGGRARGGRRRGRARAPRMTAAQRAQIRRLHARASTADVRAWLRAEPPPLVFRPPRARERLALAPDGDEGGWDAEDLALAQQALASRDGETHEVHPRLLELVYRAARHFRAPYVHVVSGYRTGSATSRHSQGRALDFVLPGVSDRRLAAYLRPQGFVGVGIYPVSGFVHLDVRARSYFWSDSSGPGQRNRERPMLAAQTARYDAAARRRGIVPIPDVELVASEGEEGDEAAADEVVAPPAAPSG